MDMKQLMEKIRTLECCRYLHILQKHTEGQQKHILRGFLQKQVTLQFFTFNFVCAGL